MITTKPEHDGFEQALTEWRKAATLLADAERVYGRTHAEGILKATAANETKRAAEASLHSEQDHYARELAKLGEQAARWRVTFLISAIGRRQPPA